MIKAILDTASYAPHGYCLLWQPWLVGLHVVADLLIAVSYFAIPFALMLFLRQRPDIQYRGLVGLFAAFILLCGITHIVSLITLWVPIYPIQGLLKLVTGIVSAVTAVVLFSLVPRLVAIPSPRQLENANAQLRAKASAHERTLDELRQTQLTLEAKVQERTAELSDATNKLAVLTREAIHRSRNLLTIVESIARQTARGASDLQGFLEAFIGRVHALANATASVVDSHPGRGHTDLKVVAERQLEPVILTFGERLRITGPSLDVSPEAAQQIGLALHELATNAQKRGALSRQGGTVDVSWSIETGENDGRFLLRWRESGGSGAAPRSASANSRFGHSLLSQIVPSTLGGVARMTVSGGFEYELSVPAMNVMPKSMFASDASSQDAISKSWASTFSV